MRDYCKVCESTQFGVIIDDEQDIIILVCDRCGTERVFEVKEIKRDATKENERTGTQKKDAQ